MRSILLALALLASPAGAETAVFAGGCFWGVEADFESLDGVGEVVSGFTGGHVDNPTYREVSGGGTGHFEAVRITYDPAVVSYDELLHSFFRSIDPTDAGGQFCDRGDSYRSAVFVRGPAQRAAAERAKRQAAADLGRPVVTPVLPAGRFWPAAAPHQDYYKGRALVVTRFGLRRQAVAYDLYRTACGRDTRVRALWGADAPFLKP